MSSSDVSGLGDGLVLVWVMAWCCWRQAITWATDNSYYVAMWRDSVNSSPASAAYTRQWTGSALVQVMTCRLSDAKPLPELMLPYCRMDSLERISMIFESKFYHVHSCKCIWNCHLPKWQPFCPREMSSNELTMTFIFVLVIPTRLNSAKLGGISFSWNIASSNFFPFQSKCLCSYKYYFSKGGFHPTHHVFKWTNVSHSSKLATSYNCTFAQICTFWPLLGPRYFSHMVRFLLLCVSFSDYNCHVYV